MFTPALYEYFEEALPSPPFFQYQHKHKRDQSASAFHVEQLYDSYRFLLLLRALTILKMLGYLPVGLPSYQSDYNL
jgi:hypothetical protein